MNRGELISLVTVATAGWLKSPERGEPPNVACATHETLLRLIQTSSRLSRPSASRDRRALLREINRITDDLVTGSIQAMDELSVSRCEFTFEQVDDDNNLSIGHFGLDEVSLVTGPFRVLKLAKTLRSLRASEQVSLVRILLDEADLSSSELHLHVAEADGNIPERDKWQDTVLDSRTSLLKAERRLSASGREWLKKSRANHPTFTALSGALPIKLELSVANDVLAGIASWYGALGRDMFQPFPVSSGASPRRIAQWRRAWARYEDFGDTFRVLGAWLRALAATDTFRRCQVCYRHLGFGMKKFCREHVRTAEQRQSSRQLHISNFYRRVVRSAVVSVPDFRSAFVADFVDPAESSALKSLASGLVVRELVQPAVTLAIYLRRLWPVLTPVLQSRVASHFEQMLALANAPFRGSQFAGATEAYENKKLRNIAPEWLSWEEFFRTWFRSASNTENSDAWRLGAGVDVDHPLARRQPVSLSKVVVDLAHLRSWLLVANQFNRLAYLSPKKVSALRTQNSTTGSESPTLASLGKQLGVSAEAVRKALNYSASTTQKSDRRKRVLPEGLQRLSRLLGSG